MQVEQDKSESVEVYRTVLEEFFGGLGYEVDKAVQGYVEELAIFSTNLGSVVDIAKQMQAELDRTAATKFSAFEYFNVSEAALSNIFADLLDPAGIHGQGDRFLSQFLNEVPCLGDNFSPADRRNCKIYREYSTEERRRIDIVLIMSNGRRVGIENKPHSRDLKNQIADYLKELEKSDKGARVLYLSGDGKDPANCSLPKECGARKRCLTVAYRKGDRKSPSIENWIQQCWRECEAERVRWFLKDLLAYVRRCFAQSDT